MKRLFLAQVPEDCDPEQDIVAGPWCFLGREKEFAHWRDWPFPPDPFPSGEALQAADQLCLAVAEHVPLEMVEELNAVNGVDYSSRYWRMMLMPWLLSLTQTTLDRYQRVEGLCARYGDQPVVVELLEDTMAWQFKDSHDFNLNGTLSIVYNHWLFSRMIESRLPTAWHPVYRQAVQPVASAGVGLSWQEKLKENIKKLLERHRCQSVYGLGRWESWAIALLLSLKPAVPVSPPCPVSPQIEPWDGPDWRVDLRQLCRRLLPACFRQVRTLRGFHWCPPKSGKYRLIGPILYNDEPTKDLLGRCVEAGERLITTQHGGNYGNARVYGLPPYIEYSQEVFFSWGWSQQEDYPGNCHPMPSPYLSRWADHHHPVTEELILVGTVPNLYLFRVASIPQPRAQLDYIGEKERFIEGLSASVLPNLRYRPYFRGPGQLDEEVWFKHRFPAVGLCTGPLHPAMMQCKLLVLDHPGTTLNIAMAANIPLICFWDAGIWQMCRQSQPFFEALRQVGMLCDDGRSAALRVNQVWPEVMAWWGSSAVQEARRNWCEHYARTDPGWLPFWLKTLWAL